MIAAYHYVSGGPKAMGAISSVILPASMRLGQKDAESACGRWRKDWKHNCHPLIFQALEKLSNRSIDDDSASHGVHPEAVKVINELVYAEVLSPP